MRVEVDPAKSPNTKQVALDVYKNVYTSATTFMKKQGMDLRRYSSFQLSNLGGDSIAFISFGPFFSPLFGPFFSPFFSPFLGIAY